MITLKSKAECFNESTFHKASLCPFHKDCERWYSEEDILEFLKSIIKDCDLYKLTNDIKISLLSKSGFIEEEIKGEEK